VLDRDSIIASIGDLAVTPRVIRHLSVFLKDPNNDIAPAIAAMKTEPVLTAAMLAACNSPAHYRGEKLLTLESAVLRLGFRETYRIALLVTFRQGLLIGNLPDNRHADYLWSRAVTAACAMETLSLSADAAPIAYTVGLLHLIGCFILARNGALMSGFDSTNPAAMARAQEAACGMAYPEVGGLALQQWEFSPEIWVPIRCQHSPAEADKYSDLAFLLSRAVALAHFIEQCRPDSPIYRPSVTSGAFADPVVGEVEARSSELMECFFPVPPRRPRWATPA
jgi:HD-like signal output (HDOD) protein